MRTNYAEIFRLMENTFRDFEELMPSKPERASLSYGGAYRYKEKNIHEAIFLKLARVHSLLRGAYLLLQQGYVHEQGILHRAIDETNEDITFLAFAMSNDEITESHEKYLEAFWEEEIDESGNMIDSSQKRPNIPRQKIRAYLSKVDGVDIDPSTSNNMFKTLSKGYSGYVHGASPHIMDLYLGNPPTFHIKGVLGTHRHDEHVDDLWNCVYRTFLSYIIVAKVFGAQKHAEILLEYKQKFESEADVEYS